tara:strand:- start:635 stop:844 length:210 start_codon:yes stop_codon:yes gene_type:complete
VVVLVVMLLQVAVVLEDIKLDLALLALVLIVLLLVQVVQEGTLGSMAVAHPAMLHLQVIEAVVIQHSIL